MIILPSSSSVKCLDRFDILDSEEPEVPFWDILKALLGTPVNSIKCLVEQLETITVTLRGTADTDYGFLQEWLQNYLLSSPLGERYFFDSIWPVAAGLALELPVLFPNSILPSLSEDKPQFVVSRRQIACLVVHQFLCSLPQLPWETDSSPSFHIWYSSNPRHPKATQAYLHALFAYFERLADKSSSPLAIPTQKWPIVFTLRALQEHGEERDLSSVAARSNLVPLYVNCLPQASTSPPLLGLPSGACVISANRNIGFGQTGTQEELQMGSSPESCPAVLVTPPLKDSQVLVVQGPEAMISMKGYGREARLDEVLAADHSNSQNSITVTWTHRTMLFMDAMELDLYDPTHILPDLLPGHIEREVVKAYTAFSSKGNRFGSVEANYTEVFTGLWGCGAFGGNREVKSVIQWCAASMANVPLHFVCAGEGQAKFAEALDVFVKSCQAKGARVEDVLDALHTWKPEKGNVGGAFGYIIKTLPR